MDIKLKNNKWGILLAFLVIVGISCGIMALYPWLKTQAFAGAAKVTEQMVNLGLYDETVANVGGQWYSFDNYWWLQEMSAWILLGAGAFTALAAFIIALVKPLGMTKKVLFKAPFEVVIFIGSLGVGLLADSGYVLMDMMSQTIIGELKNVIVTGLHLTALQADGVVLALNFLVWLILMFLVYWGVTCLTSVFTLGFFRYLKERTLTGRFTCWCVRVFNKTCDVVETVDFKDKSTKFILKIVAVNFLLLTFLTCFWFFGIFGLIIYSVILFFVLRKNYYNMQEHYQVLLKATNELAEGNLDVEIKEDLGVFEPFREEIKKIQTGFKKAVEEEVKSQSMKTELITNVSHDLKTPLTAIITYVNLLKKEDITEEERNSYIQVLDQKSMRLKSLIEDLFEVSKANSKNVTLNLVEVDIVSLMKQVRLELDDKLQDCQVDFKWNLPEEKVILTLDSEKTYRVFENLLVNIIKYAMPGTRAYVDIETGEKEICISMKNISATELSVNGSELSERFVRGDSSRNTEGSGLGLAIAKSFTELQKGSFEVETEADLFKVLLRWKREE